MRENLSKTGQAFVRKPVAWIQPKQSGLNIVLYNVFRTQKLFSGIWVNYGENAPLHVVPIYAAVFRNVSAVSKDFLYIVYSASVNLLKHRLE